MKDFFVGLIHSGFGGSIQDPVSRRVAATTIVPLALTVIILPCFLFFYRVHASTPATMILLISWACGVLYLANRHNRLHFSRIAEARLQEHRQLIAQIAGVFDEVFWMRDAASGETLYVNPAFEKISGKSCDALNRNRLEFLETVHPEDRERVAEFLQRQESGGFAERYRVIRPGGKIRWVQARAFPLRDSTGKAYRVCGVAQDITEMKEAEERLRRNERFLAALIDHVPAIVYAKDLDGLYLLSNRGHAGAVGRASDEIIGRTDRDLFPPNIAEDSAMDDRLVIQSKAPLESRSTMSQAGNERIYRTVKFPLLDEQGDPYAICGISQDVTVTLQTERALKESTARFLQIADTIQESFWIFSLDEKKVTYVSPAFEKIFGVPKQALYDGKVSILDLVHADDRPRVSELIRQIHKRGNMDIRYRIIRPDGSIRWLWDRRYTIFDENGKPLHFCGAVTDITTEKEAEIRLADLRAQMATASKLSALGEMAGSIAHEINTPLATVSALSSQLQELMDDAELDRPTIKEIAGLIEFTILRISKIIKSLRTISRDGRKDRFIPYPLAQIIDDTLVLCRTQLESAGIDFRRKSVSPEHLVECRPTEISQVLLNLLNNARDAAQGLKEKWIELAIDDLGGSYQISVTDSGGGIPAEFREKLFQSFFTTKEFGKGTGLGLNISKSIMREHQGDLRFDPHCANTRFVIVLPKRQFS